MPGPAMLSAKNFWRRVRTPYGSFLVLTAIVPCVMGCVGDRVIQGAICVLLLWAWCFYALIYLGLQPPKRQAESLRWTLRQMFVVTGCLAMIFGAIVNHWPLLWRFAISQQRLDQFADQLVDGRQLSTPRAVGLFVIRKAEMRDGLPCLWTDPDPSGYSGFVRCTPRQVQGFNIWFTEQMNDRWQLILED